MSDARAENSNDQILLAIGELKGSINGLAEVISNNNAAMNRRIDDLTRTVTDSNAAINKRIDDMNSQLSQRLAAQDRDISALRDTQNTLMMRASASGGFSGALTVALVEVVKHMM